MEATLRIGTAGWSIPHAVADRFPAGGSGLERYAARFCAAEINSTFYRSHRPQTYARWREAAPPGFAFAVKLPWTVMHEAKLVDCGVRLETFVAEAHLLGDKLGPFLVQLPPSLAFDPVIAARFFDELRARSTNSVVCEPRHPSWFGNEADLVLQAHRVARVAADPARHPSAATPGGWTGMAYWRLHGSPRMYYSAYGEAGVRELSGQLRASPAAPTWCIFDNTASGAALADALLLAEMLGVQPAQLINSFDGAAADRCRT